MVQLLTFFTVLSHSFPTFVFSLFCLSTPTTAFPPASPYLRLPLHSFCNPLFYRVFFFILLVNSKRTFCPGTPFYTPLHLSVYLFTSRFIFLEGVLPRCLAVLSPVVLACHVCRRSSPSYCRFVRGLRLWSLLSDTTPTYAFASGLVWCSVALSIDFIRCVAWLCSIRLPGCWLLQKCIVSSPPSPSSYFRDWFLQPRCGYWACFLPPFSLSHLPSIPLCFSSTSSFFPSLSPSLGRCNLPLLP